MLLKKQIDAYEDLTAVWDAMSTEDQAAAMNNYADALWAAHVAGVELTDSQMAIALVSQDIKNQLLGLPTQDVINDFNRLIGTWESLTPEEQAVAWDNYANALWTAHENGVQLSDTQMDIALSSGLAAGGMDDAAAAADRMYSTVVSAWRSVRDEAQSVAQDAYDAAIEMGKSHEGSGSYRHASVARRLRGTSGYAD